jgi:tartrate dehydratase alpha subunit/fumarate hydratase class I-like protein
MLALAASAPKAVAAEAEGAVRDMLTPDCPPPMVGYAGGMPASTGLSLAQKLASRAVKQSRRRAYAKEQAINACHSMSKAAKRAYIQDAHEEAQGLDYQFAKLMGWTNDEREDWQ